MNESLYTITSEKVGESIVITATPKRTTEISVPESSRRAKAMYNTAKVSTDHAGLEPLALEGHTHVKTK